MSRKAKGTLEITATINCGICNLVETILPGARCRSLAGIMKVLKQDGWGKTIKHGWVCGDHKRVGVSNLKTSVELRSL